MERWNWFEGLGVQTLRNRTAVAKGYWRAAGHSYEPCRTAIGPRLTPLQMTRSHTSTILKTRSRLKAASELGVMPLFPTYEDIAAAAELALKLAYSRVLECVDNPAKFGELRSQISVCNWLDRQRVNVFGRLRVLCTQWRAATPLGTTTKSGSCIHGRLPIFMRLGSKHISQ